MDKETHIIELTADMISAGWDDEAVPPPPPPKPSLLDIVPPEGWIDLDEDLKDLDKWEAEDKANGGPDYTSNIPKEEDKQVGEPVLGSELEIMDSDKPEVPDGWTIIDDNEVTKEGDCYLAPEDSQYSEPTNTVHSELGKKASNAIANYNKYAPGSVIAIIRKEKPANKETEQEKPKPQAPSEWRLLDKGEVLRDDDEMKPTVAGDIEDKWVSCSGWGGKVVGIHAYTTDEKWQFRRRIGKTPEVPLPQLPPPSDDNQSGKNLTRQLKCYCEESGYICRTTQKWLNKYGPPISPANNKPMKVEQKDDNNE